MHAANSESSLFLYTPSQIENSAKMTFIDGKESGSHSYWADRVCYHSGVPGTNRTIAKGGSCDDLPIYTYFDAPEIEAGQTRRIAIEVPEYRLDVSRNHVSIPMKYC